MPILSPVCQFAPDSCQDVWGRRDFGLTGEALSLDHHFGGAGFFSSRKIGFIFQTRYLQQAGSLRSCFLQQAYQGLVF